MKKALFICLFVSLFSQVLAAQSADSLFAKLQTDLDDTLRVNHLVNLGKLLIDNQPDTVVILAEEAIQLSNQQDFKKGLLMANNLLGNVAQRKGSLDSAMLYYNKVKQLAEQLNDTKGLAIVINNIGIVETNRGEYEAALSSYLEAYDYEVKLKDTVGMAEAYNNIGVVHYYMGDMENTLLYFKKSIHLTEQVGNLQILKKGYINVGAIHQYRKEYDEALYYYRKGLEIAQEINDEVDINLSQHNMAQIHMKRKEYDQAEEYLRSSLAFQERVGSQEGIAFDYTNLGSLYREKGQFQLAEEYYFKAIEICKEASFIKDLETTYGELAEMYSRNKQFKKAYESSKDYIQLKDSLLNEENAKNFAELRTKYETAQKEKALAEEQMKSESLAKSVVESKLTAENRNKLIIVLIALLVGISLFFMLLRQRNQRKAQAEKDAAIIEERDKGTRAVFSAQEEERKRISKDLHDGVGQQLSGLKMAFQKMSQGIRQEHPEKSEELDQLGTILSESADEVRSISHQMMPRALTELGLIDALSDMLEKSLGLSEIQYEFDHFGMNERFSENIEISLYRVCQELVNNIIKHSGAKKVSVQLFKNQQRIIMVVEDDGKGISETKSNGHGLLNMKSRINTLNGEINLEPSPTRGTLATIRIPLL